MDIQAVTMPRWGMTMTEGRVNAWLVDVGAAVRPAQEILEIETEKIANAFESSVSGILRRKLVEPGQVAPVGSLLGVIADAGTSDADIDAFIASHRAHEGERAADAAQGPSARLVAALDGQVNVLSVGPEQGTPVVLIHGFGGDLNSWLFTQPALAGDRPVHALDLPAHGGSSIPPTMTLEGMTARVAAALDSLAVGRAHVVAHSLGAAVALLLARDTPGRVASLSLIAPAGLGAEINAAYIGDFLAAERRPQMKQALGALFADPGQVKREMVDDVLRFMRTDGVPAALRQLAEDVFPGGHQRMALRGVLETTAIPCQLIWGEQDRVIPCTQAAGLPSTVVVHTIADAGHMPHMEHAGRVTALLASFIAAADNRQP
ncbi:MAG: acetoin dehydrogenase dihydrolipoyllysine-residue acetyltransferase subunit [Proteobacteria bacterium]|nr:acetoin dehydrogenase dihydrolipoyllysine-residue acetyltransferase subunit [Pseudomonadota bacterium]